MGELRRLLKAGGMLARHVLGKPQAQAQAERLAIPAGIQCDLYAASRCDPGVVLVVYGLTFAGENDPRVTRFAHSLASSGLRVVVPVLPGLKTFAVSPADVDALVALLAWLHERYGAPVRIIGFSIGAGLALVAASHPALADKLDLLILFDPYYALQDLWDEQARRPPPNPGDEAQWENFVWFQLASAYRQREQLGLSALDERALLEVLSGYADAKEEAARFYVERLQHLRLPDVGTWLPAAADLARISPAGQLSRVAARVFILHDPDYLLTPPAHSERIIAELRSRPGAAECRLLATPLISHVHPRFALRPRDLVNLLRFFGALYA